MLTSADYQLVERDAGLKGMPQVLDETRLLELFQQSFPEQNYQTLSLQYVRYKPQTSCLVRLELESGAGLEQAYATAFQTANQEKFAKAKSSSPLCNIFPELDIIIRRFPYDRKLLNLARLIDETERPHLLQKTLETSFETSYLKPLVYKPERRFVAKLETESQAYALKLYSDDAFEQAHSNTHLLKRFRDLPIAQGCGVSKDDKLIAFTWLEGQTLRELFEKAKVKPDSLYQLGQQLAHLHDQEADLFKPRSRFTEKARLEALGDWLGWLLPDVLGDLNYLKDKLGQVFLCAPQLKNLVHGDFYDKQVLFHQGNLNFIDFDEAYQGDPAHDLGLFIAHLERNILIGRLSQTQFETSLPAFLKGYESCKPLPERIALYTATELIGLAPHFFRNRHPNWPYLTRKLIYKATDLIQESYLLSA